MDMEAVTYRQERRRCGDPTCTRCKEGTGHGPYWYGYYRDGHGRLRSRYYGKTRPVEAASETADRRASAHSGGGPDGPPPLRIQMLGDFVVMRGAMTLSTRDWPRRSARALLALLLLYPGGLARDEVCEALWPEADPVASGTALKTALSVLRHALEPPDNAAAHHKSARLPPWERRLRLHLFPADSVDLHAVEAAPADPAPLSLPALTRLVDLYRGELLPEYRYEEWAGAARERLRRRWHALSLHLAARLVAAGRETAASTYLQTLLADDATAEEAARLLMTALANQGRRNLALHVYGRLVAALERELGVGPDRPSRALAERLHGDAALALAPLPSPREAAKRLKERIAQEALEQPPSSETARRLARLWAERALALETFGAVQEALGAVESGLLTLGDRDLPAERSRLLLAEATIQYRQGRVQLTHDAAAEAERAAVIAAERNLQAWALRLRAQAAEGLGQAEAAMTLARSSAALHDSLNAPEEALRSRRVLAFVLWRAGHIAQALDMHRCNHDEARRLGRPEQLAYVLCGLGQTLVTGGDLDAAEPHLLEALELAARLEDHYLVLSVEYHLANLWAERAALLQDGGGEPLRDARREARTRFERVIRLARASDSAHMLIGGALDLAVALAQWGETAQARPFLALAEQSVQEVADHVPVQGWIHLSAAELALAGGEIATAQAEVVAALPLIAAGSPAGLAQAHRVAALTWLAQGDRARADEHWMASLSAAARHGQALEDARTRRAHHAYARHSC